MQAKTPVTQRSPCYSAVSALLMNPLPDRSNYSPLCHTHYQYFTGCFRLDPLPSRELETNVILQNSLLQRFTAESSRELSALRKLNNRQVSMFLILLFKLLTQFLLSLFSLSLSSLCSLSQSSLFSLFPIPSFSSDQFFVFLR